MARCYWSIFSFSKILFQKQLPYDDMLMLTECVMSFNKQRVRVKLGQWQFVSVCRYFGKTKPFQMFLKDRWHPKKVNQQWFQSCVFLFFCWPFWLLPLGAWPRNPKTNTQRSYVSIQPFQPILKKIDRMSIQLNNLLWSISNTCNADFELVWIHAPPN